MAKRSDVLNQLRAEAAQRDAPAKGFLLKDVPGILRAKGLHAIAREWEYMQAALTAYANDEDRVLDGHEAYCVATEVGIKARQHRAALAANGGIKD